MTAATETSYRGTETCYSGKRDLPQRQTRPAVEARKRPTIEATETFYICNRDLLYREKRPIVLVKIQLVIAAARRAYSTLRIAFGI